MLVFLNILDEILGFCMLGAILFVIPFLVVSVPAFVLRRLPFDDPSGVAQRYDKTMENMWWVGFIGVVVVAVAPFVVLIDHVFYMTYYLDSEGNKVRVPDIIPASVALHALYNFLNAHGFSLTWSGVWAALGGIAALAISLLQGFESLSKFVKLWNNKPL
jgi:hypothetical protein